MTAPDDLARTLAAELKNHRQVGPKAPVLKCRCGYESVYDLERETHLAEVLASVVSRRDADLRTRIEQSQRDTRAAIAELLEIAPTLSDAGVKGYRHAIFDALSVFDHLSRVPADTDTGRGQ